MHKMKTFARKFILAILLILPLAVWSSTMTISSPATTHIGGAERPGSQNWWAEVASAIGKVDRPWFSPPSIAKAASAGVEYRIAYNSTTGLYEVYLRPNVTAGAPSQTLSAQVTVKAPHLTGASRFNPSNIQAAVSGTAWAVTSRSDAPSEDPSADYLSFELSFPTSNYGAFTWTANQEFLAFTFQNGVCSGVVSLMNNNDPFNHDPNSANTNPANQIDILGLGLDPGNDYLANYGTNAASCNSNAGVEYRIAYNSTTGLYEVYLRPNVTAGAPSQTLSAQVTVKAPHLTGASRFNPSNIQAAVSGTAWAVTSRSDAPSEDPSADYLSFELSFPTSNYGAFTWTANQEFLAFTFQNGVCSGVVSLMNNNDPFNHDPNSANTNPANQIDILGLGLDPGNDYLANYGTNAASCNSNAGVEYRIAYNSTTGLYEVYLRPNVTAGAPSQTLSAQVTVKAPHLTGASRFNPSNIQAAVSGTAWAVTSRSDAPSEDPSADYLSFELSFPTSNYGAFTWTANQEFLAFTFQNGVCSGVVSLMNNNDPFNHDPNSANTNPANQIDILGLGLDPGNDYLANYGTNAATCSLGPDLIVTLGQPSPALVAGVQSNLPVTVTNIGNGPTSGPITVNVPLPAYVSAPASFTSNGWSCTNSGTTVTCTNPGPLNNGVNSPFTIPITSNSDAAGTTPIFNASVSTPNETTTTNNNATPVTANVAATALPDGCYATTVSLSGSQQAPANASTATGSAVIALNTLNNTLSYTVTFSGLSSAETMAHIHGFAGNGLNAGILVTLPSGSPKVGTWNFAEADQAKILGGETYVNVHTVNFGGGEIRAQLQNWNATTCASVILPIKVFLGGAYNQSTGLMRDDLRTKNLIPTTEPYTGISGFTHKNGGGGEQVNASVFSVTGNNAIVDWVFVELRNSVTPATVVATRAALVQRDGDVVGLDGVTSLVLPASFYNQSYDIAVRHRNHLGVMTASPVTLTPTTALIDFTLPATAVYGTNAEKTVGSARVLWNGNANTNKNIIYTGPNNDVNSILITVLSAPGNSGLNRNYIVTGYNQGDIDLDGRTIAAGPGNDVNPILANVYTHPGNAALAANYIIVEQLP